MCVCVCVLILVLSCMLCDLVGVHTCALSSSKPYLDLQISRPLDIGLYIFVDASATQIFPDLYKTRFLDLSGSQDLISRTRSRLLGLQALDIQDQHLSGSLDL